MNLLKKQKVCVSIICNTYNHGKYIKNALDSFISQETNFNYEILIHDDASTDNTADIIREYEKNILILLSQYIRLKTNILRT